MAKKKHAHEDHVNHEAWAIPYGDLVTLLLAFFVVMYSISSINEGKYRVLSDALSEAFGGPPKSLRPIQFGTQQQRGSEQDQRVSVIQSNRVDQTIGGTTRDLRHPPEVVTPVRSRAQRPGANAAGSSGFAEQKAELARIGSQIEKALQHLVDADLITVRSQEFWLEVEVKTDILFASGDARVADQAIPVLFRIADVLRDLPNRVRVEGYTDAVPIATAVYPSNWELSAARAAGIVRTLIDARIGAERLSVLGFGEQHPVGDNATAEGRAHNRRIVLVVLADDRVARQLEQQARATGAAEAEAQAQASAAAQELPPEQATSPAFGPAFEDSDASGGSGPGGQP